MRHKQFEKFAQKVIAEYQRKLLLDRYTITIAPRTTTEYMECGFRVPYLDVTIGYNPEKIERDWKAGRKADLTQALIHELCHVVTDPLYAKASDRYAGKNDLESERETLTDHIAMIIVKNRI